MVVQHDLRGLDYVLGATVDGDILALVHRNSNYKDAVTAVRATDGSAYFQSSITPGFQEGLWGFRATGLFGEYAVGWTSWPERSALELHELSEGLVTEVSVPIDDSHGLAMSDFGVFYVVDAKSEEVVTLSATGEWLSAWLTPDIDPQGLSFIKAE